MSPTQILGTGAITTTTVPDGTILGTGGQDGALTTDTIWDTDGTILGTVGITTLGVTTLGTTTGGDTDITTTTTTTAIINLITTTITRTTTGLVRIITDAIHTMGVENLPNSAIITEITPVVPIPGGRRLE